MQLLMTIVLPLLCFRIRKMNALLKAGTLQFVQFVDTVASAALIVVPWLVPQSAECEGLQAELSRLYERTSTGDRPDGQFALSEA